MLPTLLLSIMIASGAGEVVQPSPDAIGDLSAADIADRFERTYEEARFIRFDGRTVTSDGEEIEYSYEGTPDSFRTISTSGGELYGAFSYERGRIQEFVPGHPKRLILTYDAEEKGIVGELVYPRSLDCYYGHTFTTWVGADAYPWNRIAGRIRDGRVVNRATIEERECYVVEWQQSYEQPDDTCVVNTWLFYIDSDSFFVRRMDSVNTMERDGSAVERERREIEFRKIEVSPDARDVDCCIWSNLPPAVRLGERVAPSSECSHADDGSHADDE